MEIPKQFCISGRRYTVNVTPGAVNGEFFDRRGAFYGGINYDTRNIYVGTHGPDGKKSTPRSQAHTFWHEVTHAILKDMRSKLEANEAFVDRFARRLNDVIHTAKF